MTARKKGRAGAGQRVIPRLGAMKMMDFDQVEHSIEEGYIGVMEKVDDIRNLLKQTGG